jgi:kynureninase
VMNGTPAIPAYYAALAGLDIVNEIGVDRIRAHSVRLTARILELVDLHGFASAAARDRERLAGTVAIAVPEALRVSQTLKARDFIVDYRPPVGVRISPHFYNTIEEVDRIVAEIADIVATKHYTAPDGHSRVT